MTEQPPGDSDMDAIDLAIVLAALRQRWWVVLGCTIAALLVGAVQLRNALPVYQVEMTVGAVEHSAYDARRAAPGVRVETRDAAARQTSTNAMEFALYVESLQGRAVADALAKNPEVPKLVGGGADGAQLNRFLLRNLTVGQDQKKHAFATIALQSTRPELAVRLLALLHQATDDLLRQRALVRSRQLIAGLAALPNPDAATIAALGEQHVTEAAALSQAPFAAQLVDPPAALPDPIGSPFRTLVGALFLGLAAGAALALLLEWLGAWRAGRSRTAAP